MAKGAQGAPEVLPIDEAEVDEQLKQEFANDETVQPELPGMDVPQPERANV
jgi:hypothetical protein